MRNLKKRELMEAARMIARKVLLDFAGRAECFYKEPWTDEESEAILEELERIAGKMHDSCDVPIEDVKGAIVNRNDGGM